MTRKVRSGQNPKKRPRRPSFVAPTPVQPSDVESVSGGARAASAAASQASRLAAPQRVARPVVTRPSNIPQDYGHVLADLKRVGVTSALMFAIIIVLSLVMR